jgi:hypothetical protein
MSHMLRPLVLCLFTVSCLTHAQATTYTSTKVDVALTATVANGLSTTIAVPTVLFGVVATGTANAAPLAQAISVVSTWNLGVGQTVKMYAFFDSASAAMTGTLNGQMIPTSALSASVNGGSAQSFTSASPFTSGSTSATIYSVLISTANAVSTRAHHRTKLVVDGGHLHRHAALPGAGHMSSVLPTLLARAAAVRRTCAATFSRMSSLAAVLLLFCFATGRAQGVSPSVVQYTAAAEGSFLVTNDGLTPLFVTIDTHSFSVDADSNAVFSPLDKGIHLELSQTSLRVPPRQQRTVYYKASADHYPAWFSVYANFSGLPRHNGLNVQLSLPHTVYLLARQPVTAREVHFTGLQIDGARVRGMLHNDGNNVVRVHELDVVSHGKNRSTGGGFPLLPGGVRAFSLDLPKGEKADMVRAHLEKFTVEQALP